MTAEELRSIEPLLPLLRQPPLGILSDIDGTLAPIVSNPEDAHISVRSREALRGLMAQGVQVAFITGRAVEKARQMVGLPGTMFAGNHGLNIWDNGALDAPEVLREYVGRARQVIADVCGTQIPGVIVEDKGPVVAFHYRKAPSEAEALAAIRKAIAGSGAAKAFLLQEGRKVLELRPPLPLDKGTALSGLAARMGVKAVLCMGDDATDVDMFRGVNLMRAEGMLGRNIGVWSPEVNPIVLESTDYFVRGVEGIEWMLEELLRALAETGPSGRGTGAPARR